MIFNYLTINITHYCYFRNLINQKSTIENIKIWFICTLLILVIYSIYPVFRLDENQILYLFSSASQVVAAIYGLIITGYIFLRNELDRKAEKDETYEEIIANLKSEYFNSIINISLVTLLSISLCFLVIVDATSNTKILLDLLINISISVILAELVLIVSFVVRILNPKSLEIESDKIRAKTKSNSIGEKGSIEDFLKNYNQIEYILSKYGSAITNPELSDFESIKKKRIANTKLVYILFNVEKINADLKNDLIELISFRNSLIHGSSFFVTKKSVEQSENVLNRLRTSLGVI